jgi:P22_AR N-terminal domain
MAEELTGDAGATDAGDAAVAIVPVRERYVDFYGDQIVAAQTADEEIYVPVRPICTYLGLSWPGQRERINRDPVLAEAIRSVRVTRTEAGEREVLCLPLEFLPGWLFGISAARVKPELQEKITRYRRECFRVLWNAFKGDVLAAGPALPAADISGAALALEIATAVQHMAQQQLDMEARLGQVAGRQEVMAEYMRGFIQKTEGRLTNLELQLSGGSTISEAQAAEIALAVKNVGQRLVSQGDKNGYAKVYSEMYRRYRISSYKNLPAARYQEVLDWLHAWYGELEV